MTQGGALQGPKGLCIYSLPSRSVLSSERKTEERTGSTWSILRAFARAARAAWVLQAESEAETQLFALAVARSRLEYHTRIHLPEVRVRCKFKGADRFKEALALASPRHPPPPHPPHISSRTAANGAGEGGSGALGSYTGSGAACAGGGGGGHALRVGSEARGFSDVLTTHAVVVWQFNAASVAGLVAVGSAIASVSCVSVTVPPRAAASSSDCSGGGEVGGTRDAPPKAAPAYTPRPSEHPSSSTAADSKSRSEQADKPGHIFVGRPQAHTHTPHTPHVYPSPVRNAGKGE